MPFKKNSTKFIAAYMVAILGAYMRRFQLSGCEREEKGPAAGMPAAFTSVVNMLSSVSCRPQRIYPSVRLTF